MLSLTPFFCHLIQLDVYIENRHEETEPKKRERQRKNREKKSKIISVSLPFYFYWINYHVELRQYNKISIGFHFAVASSLIMCFSEHAFCINLFKYCNWSISSTKVNQENARTTGMSVNLLIAITFSFRFGFEIECENWISRFLIRAIEKPSLSVSLKHSNKSNISTIRFIARSLSPLPCKPSQAKVLRGVCMCMFGIICAAWTFSMKHVDVDVLEGKRRIKRKR